jgi:hypothetical protein
MERVEGLLACILSYRLRTLDVQIYDHGILPAPDYYRFTRDIWPGIDFLMRDVGGNVNEVSWVGFVAEL